MIQYLKYLGMIGALKDISAAYKEAQGTDKPWWLSRRLIGALIVAGSVFVAIQFGVQISETDIVSLTDRVEVILSAATAVYGAAMFIIGLSQRIARGKKE